MSRYQVLSESEARQSYEEMLDECYPQVELGYSTFSASDILRTMDPTAYEIGFTEYCDNAADDECFLVEGYTSDRLEEDDGQPDEAQEWADFDADC